MKPQFEIDLRVERVSQDAILQDEEKMKEVNESLKIGSDTQSIRNFLSKSNMIFSEESSRAIYEMGNMGLIELRQTSATAQCPSCLKHVPEGLNMCDAGLREGLPALLDLRDVVIEVLQSSKNRETPTQQAAGNRLRKEVRSTNSNTKFKKKEVTGMLMNCRIVDHVVTIARSSQCEAQLYILEDNEAVIKMIIKGGSPTMRHVSRTHRVALDWLFDRINLDP